jgi:AbrB family looped-hinge helix DNA binding protein
MSGPATWRDPPHRWVSARARLRPKSQLTLPEEIRRALHVREGDEIEFTVREDGTIAVRGYVSVPADYAWLYTRPQVALPPNEEPVKGQGGSIHESTDAMFTHLDMLGAADA